MDSDRDELCSSEPLANRQLPQHTVGASQAGTSPLPTGSDRLLYEIERLQRELDTLGRELAWSHRLATLGTLAAAAAHEVNNILTPIASYAQLALSDPSDRAMTTKALEIASNNALRAAQIFSATLGYARDDRGQGVAATSPIGDVVDQALACLPRELERDGIMLTADLQPATLAIHPTELQQVVLNLLLNARKALLVSERTRPSIAITGRVDADRSVYQLAVADNGPGIPAALRDRLFEPFATAMPDDKAASAARQGGAAARGVEGVGECGTEVLPGTGLGLAVCRRLIEGAQGSIRVDSQPGCGARFTIALPVSETDAFTHPT